MKFKLYILYIYQYDQQYFFGLTYSKKVNYCESITITAIMLTPTNMIKKQIIKQTTERRFKLCNTLIPIKERILPPINAPPI